MSAVACDVLLDGPSVSATGLVLSAPISFWGGVEAASGIIQDVRHPQMGRCVAGRILFLPGTIGSSSSSSVLAELVRNGMAPAALVMHAADVTLLAGLLAAREMGWKPPIALRLDRSEFAPFDERNARISSEGKLSLSE